MTDAIRFIRFEWNVRDHLRQSQWPTFGVGCPRGEYINHGSESRRVHLHVACISWVNYRGESIAEVCLPAIEFCTIVDS
jgi:hypothetical protein